MRIAIIGSGISGNLAARLLNSEHEVYLFEANRYLGGHTNTIDVQLDGRAYPVDTGFMVFNDRTYPNFCRMLEILGVGWQDSDMSFSVRSDRTGLEYQGSSLNGLFAQRSNLLQPRFYQMLAHIVRFNRAATLAVETDGLSDEQTVGDFIRQHRLGDAFITAYLVPMAAAIWSTRPDAILEFPAKFMIGFFRNHGLLQLRDRPQWRTVVGGARTYVDRLVAPLEDRIRLNCPVKSVARADDHVLVKTKSAGTLVFDHVVFATHADQTLSILADASRAERQILGCFPYQSNEAVLHTDSTLLPSRRRAWASWNYHVSKNDRDDVVVTYDVSRLQNHQSSTPILVTLNRTDGIDPNKIVQTIDYHHPAYSRDSAVAQRRHAEISGVHRTHFCGAYWGYGFHEDGANSAIAVSRRLLSGINRGTTDHDVLERIQVPTGQRWSVGQARSEV